MCWFISLGSCVRESSYKRSQWPPIYFWDSILVYILGESMSRPLDFCERGEQPILRISGSLPYSSLHPSLCDLSSCFVVGWPLLTFLSFCFFLSLFYYSISLYLIWFLYFLILLDVWLGFNIYTLFLLIRYVIHLLSFSMWESLGPRLMMFSMHCVSCMRGMRIISLGSLSLVSFYFFHPITSTYVTSRVLRPPWGHDFTLCLTTHTWAILEIGWRLFLGAWWMGSWGDGLH